MSLCVYRVENGLGKHFCLLFGVVSVWRAFLARLCENVVCGEKVLFGLITHAQDVLVMVGVGSVCTVCFMVFQMPDAFCLWQWCGLLATTFVTTFFDFECFPK